MKPTIIFQEFEHLAKALDVKIIKKKGNFKGGYCILEKEGLIVVNKFTPIEQRIRALAQAFSKMDISKIYVKPAIRCIIDSESKHS